MKKKRKNKFNRDIITIIALILALIVLAILYMNTSGNPKELTFEEFAQTFCDLDNVMSVSICNGVLIQVESSLLGGGSKFIHQDGTQFSCPVVSPESTSSNCKAVFTAQQSPNWQCKKVC